MCNATGDPKEGSLVLLSGFDEIGDAEGEGVVEDDDFAARDETAVDEEIKRLTREAVKLYDGPGIQCKNVRQRQLGAS
jgi:hypothetical protein